MLPLAGTSAKALGGEVFDHRDEWDFLKLAPSLAKRPVLPFSAIDGTGPNSEALLQALQTAGNTRSRCSGRFCNGSANAWAKAPFR